MRRPSFRSLVVLCLLAGDAALHAATPPAPAEPPLTVPSFGPRFKEIHERIDALYQYRNGNYPPPDPSLNLFRSATERAAPVEIAKEATPVEAPPDPEAVVRQAITTLRGGIIKPFIGRAYFVANNKRYVEGDAFTARFRDKPVSIRVKKIEEKSVILSYENTDVTVTSNQLKE